MWAHDGASDWGRELDACSRGTMFFQQSRNVASPAGLTVSSEPIAFLVEPTEFRWFEGEAIGIDRDVLGQRREPEFGPGRQAECEDLPDITAGQRVEQTRDGLGGNRERFRLHASRIKEKLPIDDDPDPGTSRGQSARMGRMADTNHVWIDECCCRDATI